MIVLGLVFAALAAALHVFIFYLESIAWTGPRARAVFGATEQQALATKEMAYNQGFYNLFLALAAALGVLLTAAGHSAVGATLVLTGTGCMLGAALVLGLSSRSRVPAALRQGTLPALAVVCTVVGLLLR